MRLVYPNVGVIDLQPRTYRVVIVADQVQPYEVKFAGDLVAFDIETEIVDMTKRKPRRDEITMLQAYDGHTCYIWEGETLIARGIAALENLQLRPYRLGNHLVGFNSAKFDDPITGLESDDAMLPPYILNETGKHNLEAMAVQYLEVRPWKHLFGKSRQEMIQYAANDAVFTHRLWQKTWRELSEEQRRLYTKILLPASRAFAAVERNGCYLNADNVREAKKHFGAIKAARFWELAQIGANHGAPKFNPGSPQQVGHLLFNLLSLPCAEWTASGQPATSESALQKLALTHPHPALEAIVEWRHTSKMIGTYLDGFAKFADADSRIHPQYFLVTGAHAGMAGGTVTGRTSATNPAIQTVPRDSRIRRIISAPPGHALIAADYSQIELRVAAWIADEQNLLAAYQAGNDVHALMARTLTGRDEVTKEERSRAKTVNFASLYGSGPAKIAEIALDNYDIVLTPEEALEYWRAFHKRWPGFGAYYKKVLRELQKGGGAITSVFGRTRHLPEIFSSDMSARADALRQGINFLIQSPASDLALMGTTFLVEEGYKVVVFNHDSVLIEVPDYDVAEDYIYNVKLILEKIVPHWVKEHFGITIPVPLIADVTVGTVWQ